MGDRISLRSCVGGRNFFDFSVEDRNLLDFSVGDGIDFIFVWVVAIGMVVVSAIKNDLILEWWS